MCSIVYPTHGPIPCLSTHICVQCSVKKPASGRPSPEAEKVETTPLLKDVEKSPPPEVKSTGTIQDAEESLEVKPKRDFQTIKVPKAAVSGADLFMPHAHSPVS